MAVDPRCLFSILSISFFLFPPGLFIFLLFFPHPSMPQSKIRWRAHEDNTPRFSSLYFEVYQHVNSPFTTTHFVFNKTAGASIGSWFLLPWLNSGLRSTKRVFSMDELKRNPILILRFDGEDLKEFFCSTQFESEMITMFSQIQNSSTLRNCIMMALEKLTVDHGLPPASDPWVYDNIVDPALHLLSVEQLELSASEEIFLKEFKKLICDIIKRLQDQPIIVAHTQYTFDGSGIRRLLSNKFELNKLLDLVWRDLSKESNVNAPSELLRVAVDSMATSADLPHCGTVDQVDTIVNEILGIMDSKEEKILLEEQFKKMMTDILGNLMLQLDGNPIFISSNSVVHEPLALPSNVIPLPTFSQQPEI